MGWGQEAYDAECAAVARSSNQGPRARNIQQSPSSRTAIWGMTSDDQVQARNTRSYIAALRAKEPASASMFDGALATTGVLRTTRSPTSEPSRSPANRTPTEWSGSASRTHTTSPARDISRPRGPSLTSSVTSQNANRRSPETVSAENLPDRAKSKTGPHRGRRQQTPRPRFTN